MKTNNEKELREFATKLEAIRKEAENLSTAIDLSDETMSVRREIVSALVSFANVAYYSQNTIIRNMWRRRWCESKRFNC